MELLIGLALIIALGFAAMRWGVDSRTPTQERGYGIGPDEAIRFVAEPSPAAVTLPEVASVLVMPAATGPGGIAKAKQAA